MKNSRKAWIIFRRIVLLLFIIFLINYFQVENGSYNSETKKTILTEEKIKEFEEDVKNGDFIDIKDYTTDEYIDTSTVITNVGYDTGEAIDDFINNKVVGFFKYIGSFFSN